MGFWIALAVVALVVLWLIGIYNSLIQKRIYVRETESRIDVNLKQKINVLNNLLDLLRMQTSYEGDTLERVIEARNQMSSPNVGEALKANDTLNKSILPSVFALAESYPVLKANEGFMTVMKEVENSESKVAFARTAYNTAVFAYNTAIQVFPAVLVANLFGFKPENMYELDDTQRQQADDFRISEQ